VSNVHGWFGSAVAHPGRSGGATFFHLANSTEGMTT
jgi:hypothetical protein